MMEPELAGVLSRLRAAAPLVHNITNQVVANLTANALLAIGASPAMVQAEEEVAEFAAKAASLVVNIGTLTAPQLAAMHLAAGAAAQAGRPWVLDPVAAGATAFRREAARALLARRPTVLRGNASEILALAGAGAGAGAGARGVDSAHGSEAARDAARDLAARFGIAVAVTGAVDYVTDGAAVWAVANGHPLLTRVTGTGCTATALIGAFLGAGLSGPAAAVAALAVLGVVAEGAAEDAAGPASFQAALLDGLHRLEDGELAARARISRA